MTRTDRRVQRTRTAIHQALMSLMQERPYADITIQHVLDRANVGRSTFYVHFREKDEILLAAVDDLHAMLAAAQEAARSSRNAHENVIAFSRAMFEHAAEFKKVYRTLVQASVWPRVRQGIQEVIAELIRRDVKRLGSGRSDIPVELLVHYLASTFMTVLTWSLEQRSSLAPAEADTFYRALVLPTLRASV